MTWCRLAPQPPPLGPVLLLTLLLAACGSDDAAANGERPGDGCGLRETLLLSEFVPPGFCPGDLGLPAGCTATPDRTWVCEGTASLENGRACVAFTADDCELCAPPRCTVGTSGLTGCDPGCAPDGRTCFEPDAGTCAE